MNKKITIGLFGYGCVGNGLFQILNRNELPFAIKKICVKNINKQRDIDASWFTNNKNELLLDDSIQIIVELIDDADEAFQIVKQALLNGKQVVSANKKMIAQYFNQLYALQKQTGNTLLYEGAVCGSIPAIRILDSYYANEQLLEVAGILNGTTNYILTQMADASIDYKTALQKATLSGFAESNPVMDVEAFDPVFKLQLILAHAFGLIIPNHQILRFGIQHISSTDTRFAKQLGCKIKLIARIINSNEGISAYVMPAFIQATDALFNIQNENNALSIQPRFADKQFFSGKGAGSFPTASAVLSDLGAIENKQAYSYTKLIGKTQTELGVSVFLKVYMRGDNISNVCQIMNLEKHWTEGKQQFAIGSIALKDLLNVSDKCIGNFFVAAFSVEQTLASGQISDKSELGVFSIH
jgi:homoserine dehydrogenase